MASFEKQIDGQHAWGQPACKIYERGGTNHWIVTPSETLTGRMEQSCTHTNHVEPGLSTRHANGSSLRDPSLQQTATSSLMLAG